MISLRKFGHAALIGGAMIVGSPVIMTSVSMAQDAPAAAPAAQEASAEQVALALEVVRAAGATRGFDNVLPLLAQQATDRLIRLRPDLHKQITDTVEAAALKLTARRIELDTDVARIWAKYFSQEELQTLLTFYQSTAGKKLAETGPQVLAEAYQAVDRWSSRIGEELLENTRQDLRAQGIELGN